MADRISCKDERKGLVLIRLPSDLSRMYKLFSRVSAGLDEMKEGISKYIMQLGAEINKNINADLASAKAKAPADRAAAGSGGPQVAIRWVEQVLALQEKFDKILELAANKDRTFQVAFNEVSNNVLNCLL